jgi:hypothetical protein
MAFNAIPGFSLPSGAQRCPSCSRFRAQLAGIQAAVTQLLDAYETFMGGTLIEALCLWREAAQRHQNAAPGKQRRR